MTAAFLTSGEDSDAGGGVERLCMAHTLVSNSAMPHGALEYYTVHVMYIIHHVS